MHGSFFEFVIAPFITQLYNLEFSYMNQIWYPSVYDCIYFMLYEEQEPKICFEFYLNCEDVSTRHVIKKNMKPVNFKIKHKLVINTFISSEIF